MRVLFSRPLTAPRGIAPPPYYDELANESDLSLDYSRRWRRLGRWSEQAARVGLARGVLQVRHRYDCLVTGKYGELVPLLQDAVPLGRRPLVLLDAEWMPSRDDARGRAALAVRRRMIAGAARIQVFSDIMVENYVRYFRVPAEKFVVIPYCTDAPALAPSPEAGSFALCSGTHGRDYPTLLAAMRGLPLRLKVVAPHEAFRGMDVPPNVEILGRVLHQQYQQLVADCAFMVLALQPGLLRNTGIVTYVEAMRMGKAVLLNDPDGACTYVDDGRTGWLVPPRDVAALRERLAWAAGHPDAVEAVARAAGAEAAARFAGACYFPAVDAVVRTVA